jgi:Na+-translocating ferredoxin:NAD+ oxidoreductase subunit D
MPGTPVTAAAGRVIQVRTSPHVHAPRSVDMIMRNVVYAMLPIAAYGVWLFGWSALALIATTTVSCVLAEHVFCRLVHRETSVNDYSVMITGILLGLILPPGLPLWMAVLGSLIAVLPGKMIFGGLGHNVFNPALVGRAFLQAAFPVAISSYYPAMYAHRFSGMMTSSLALPLMKAAPDGLSGATPLAQAKFDHIITDPWTLFLGLRPGSIGETCMPLILICGLYLIVRKMMDWRIPTAMLLGAVAMGAVFRIADPKTYPGALFVLFSGGLMLGAMFMATDPVASPVTPRGMWIYGILMGVLTVLIRFKGGLSEGVMYAILLGNALSPLIDHVTQPRTYGERKKSLLKGAAA